jgi:aryl-alcohol dehydrogenase-like predicted oxidoreductase
MGMRYKIFGEHSGLRVSELVLGAGLFGTAWGYGAERTESQAIFDGYLEAGGNFIDTSDAYQFGESETFLGEFLPRVRDDIVLATKYSQSPNPKGSLGITGNSRKNMIHSVEQSLKRLATDRLDIFWVHMPDAVTPIEEIMRGLDDLVRSGKTIYVGLSDFPAWRTASASTLAQLRGWAPIIAQQIEFSLVERSADRELLPMAQAHGLATVGWSPLGGGVLTGKYRRGETGRQTGMGRLFHAEDTDQKTRIIDTVESIAGDIGVSAGQVAIAWVAAKGVLPIIGPRTRAQLDDNLKAVDVRLDAAQLQALDDVSAITLGFPHDMLLEQPLRNRLAGGNAASIDWPARMVR